MRKPGHVWLLGLSGSGKSTVGPLLAQKLQMPFHDTDQMIGQGARRSIPDIFSSEGEKGFRERESDVILKMEKQKPAVIACGGGAVLHAENRQTMERSGTRVYLRVPLEVLEKRLRHQQDRPLLAHGSLTSTLAEQLSQRQSWYQESEIQLEAGQDSPGQLAQKILEKLTATS